MYNQQQFQQFPVVYNTSYNLLTTPDVKATLVSQSPGSSPFLQEQPSVPSMQTYTSYNTSSFMSSSSNPQVQTNQTQFPYSSFNCYPAPQIQEHQHTTTAPVYSPLQHPHSLSFFPSYTVSSPPVSPNCFPAPLSFPLTNPQICSYAHPSISYTNPPLSYMQHSQMPSIPEQRIDVAPNCSFSSAVLNPKEDPINLESVLQTEDDILNEAIETAIEQSDVKSVSEYPSSSSSALSASSNVESTIQKTIFEETLENIDDAQLSTYMQTGFLRPESVKKKMHWTESMYRAFCLRLNTQMFPLQGKIVGAFLHMLAIDCHYAITSLTNVIYPSLLHLQQDAGFEADPAENAIIKSKLRSLQLDPHVKKEGKGKEPLCWFDVLELISRIPDSFGTKDMEASLFLFALQTGSRACTCGGITWGDIIHYEDDETSGASRIIILQRITKGNQNWNHKVKLEGFLNEPNNGDFIYFFERHTKKTLHKSIKDVAQGNIPEHLKREHVWNLSLDAMRERLKTRLIQAGFPANHFSFHSFRSGFICSSLLLAGRDPAQQGSVLDHTAFIAGWVPYGRAQKRYVKSVAEVMIVASRLVGAGVGLKRNENEDDQIQKDKQVHVISTERKKNSSQYNHDNNSIIIIEKESSTCSSTNTPITISSSNVQAASVGFIQTPHSIEEFHNFVLQQPDFGVKGMLTTTKLIFSQMLGLSSESTNDQKRLCTNAWIRSLTILGKSSLQEKGQYKTSWAQNRLEGHQIIEKRLLEDNENPATIAEECYNSIKNLYNIELAPPKLLVTTNTLHLEPKARRMLTGKNGKAVRTRLRWNEEDNKKLLDFFQQNNSFINITSVLPDRTSADAWSHYHHLCSKAKTDSQHSDTIPQSTTSN